MPSVRWEADGRHTGAWVGWSLVKTFEELFAELADKAATRPAGSGTVAALDAGVHAIGKKVVEEAAEAWMAAEHEGRSGPRRRSASCSTTCRSSCWRPGSPSTTSMPTSERWIH